MASKDLASGANPLATFPNSHLGQTPSKLNTENWAPPEASTHSPVEQLRAAVEGHNWAEAFAEGKTTMQAEAKWSATAERCAVLQCLCTLHKAVRVLEVGSFCGVAAMAMAEAIPKDGEVLSLELEPYFVDFGKKYRNMSHVGSKISVEVGPAAESLKQLVAKAKGGGMKTFDFAVIEGDKATMAEYLELVRTPGILSDQAVVCMDVTPFKGQPPTRYKKFGAEEKWKTSSGEEEIKALRASISALPEIVMHEFGGLLVIQGRHTE
jgi:predicted O-methyltransferase YrrM